VEGAGGSTSSTAVPDMEKVHMQEQIEHLKTRCALYENKFQEMGNRIQYIENYLAAWEKTEDEKKAA
jgi:hypothetical protein